MQVIKASASATRQACFQSRNVHRLFGTAGRFGTVAWPDLFPLTPIRPIRSAFHASVLQQPHGIFVAERARTAQGHA